MLIAISSVDYFAENPRFPESMFRRRFRMGRSLFLCIFDTITMHDDYFVQRRDDATDEYIKIGESTVLESLKRFFRAVVEVFGSRYLRSPNADDVARLLHIGERRGFLGMFGSLDCMHSDYDLWIWHAYFGLSGSNNNINVLEASHLFADLAEVKRILGYLVGSLDHGIHLTKCSSFAVQAFCEADWASDPDDRRSTSGYCVLLDSNLVAWKSKKQQTISRSSTEVEFHNLAALVTDITWL
uniref:Mitochondrial protein n=1 Tax=Cannabis sativa TaxID=3483 RepID=A0A803QCG2_CANSA